MDFNADPQHRYRQLPPDEVKLVISDLDFNLNLDNKKAIYIPFAQAVPKVATIDANYCLHQKAAKNDRREETCIFITEGLSASGSITATRNPDTQAVFSLRGKPYNSYGHTKEIVYKNEEFNYLQAALNIEDGLDGLRYNKIIIATDADVDGMHIRMLLLTLFLQFFLFL